MNDLRGINKEECNPCVENWEGGGGGGVLDNNKRQQKITMQPVNMQEEVRSNIWKNS